MKRVHRCIHSQAHCACSPRAYRVREYVPGPRQILPPHPPPKKLARVAFPKIKPSPPYRSLQPKLPPVGVRNSRRPVEPSAAPWRPKPKQWSSGSYASPSLAVAARAARIKHKDTGPLAEYYKRSSRTVARAPRDPRWDPRDPNWDLTERVLEPRQRERTLTPSKDRPSEEAHKPMPPLAPQEPTSFHNILRSAADKANHLGPESSNPNLHEHRCNVEEACGGGAWRGGVTMGLGGVEHAMGGEACIASTSQVMEGQPPLACP